MNVVTNAPHRVDAAPSAVPHRPVTRGIRLHAPELPDAATVRSSARRRPSCSRSPEVARNRYLHLYPAYRPHGARLPDVRVAARPQHRPYKQSRARHAGAAGLSDGPLSAPGDAHRLESRGHLCAPAHPPHTAGSSAGHHLEQPDPAGPARAESRQPAVSPLRPRAHRDSEFAAGTRRRPAFRSRHIDLHPARRDRRMADLPGRALSSRGEHRSFRQSPRHRQLPSGPLGDRGPTRSARRRWKPFQRPSLLRTAYPAPGS